MGNETIQEIKLKKGQSTTITFEGLATAGYQWNYTVEKNADLVTISKDYMMQGQVKEMAKGASADEIFTIKANETGVVNMHFFQQRSWEKNVNPAKEKNVKVIIE